jgi:ABC-type sugar transport system permease subunit
VDEDLAHRANSLRWAAVVTALVAGLGLGLALVVVWRLGRAGLGDVAFAVSVLLAVTLSATAFSLLQARSLASLLEQHRVSQAGIVGDLERRVVGIESELTRRDEDAAIQPDGP